MVGLVHILRCNVHNSSDIDRYRVVTTAVLTTLLLALVPNQAHAQKPLAGLIKRVLDVSTVNPTSPNTAPTAPPGATIPHEPHFIIGENVKLTTREVNLALASQIAAFPLPSSSGGFTFSVNDRGDVTPTSTNFGPSFAERGVTIGRKQVNFGVSFQATSFDSFEGIGLDSNEISFIREHNDCCPAAPANNYPVATSDPAAVTPFTPAFELDLLRSNLRASIDTKTTAFFANYGVSNRFDIGIAVPIVNVQMDATVVSEIIRNGSAATPLTHSFGGGVSTGTFTESGSATGVGDVLLRAKYNFLRTSTAALAAALDLRLPTGDKDELLGTGATQTKLLFVASGEYGRFSPHVNVGYTFSSGDASEEATSFDLDPATFNLGTVPTSVTFRQNAIDLSVPDEVNYTLGFSVAATSKVTLGFDMYGRSFQDVARFGLENNVYSRPPYTANNEFSVETGDGNLNTLLGVVGGKINLGGTFLLNVTVLFQMNDAGLKPKPTPVIGFDYVF